MLSRDPRVKLLDPHTINQIAAGEVVERPASVVKELVENALDAGATRVAVEVQGAGKALIRVTDNGTGMGLADAQTALLRHATSKIDKAGDLLGVRTLGFRGEALPSIASVSRLRLSTGSQDGLRHVLVVEGGRAEEPRAEAGPRGTDIRVEDLFFNTPARLKFLKSDSTELSAIMEVMSRYALAYPGVSFRVQHGEVVTLETIGSGDLLAALGEVWGRDAARALSPVDFWNGEVRVTGFVSPPHFTKPNRAYQWFFANGRPVRSRMVAAALDQAYRSLTPERRFPLALLMLHVDPVKLDVNVSPTKSEVKFQSEGSVFDAVRRGVRTSLLEGGMVPSLESVEAASEAMRAAQAGAGRWPIEGSAPLPSGFTSSYAAQAPLPQSESFELDRLGPLPDLLDGFRVIGQLESTFILAENARGLLVIDQHVAHERILYERLRDTRGSVSVERQPLLAPETLHISRKAMAAIRDKLDDLREVGFDLEPFGGESLLVRGVPAALRTKKPMALLRDLVDELADGEAQGCLLPARDEVFILCACKMAVKAGDPLSHTEMEKLARDLAGTENPYLCPHGRPITVVLSRQELLRRFKRA